MDLLSKLRGKYTWPVLKILAEECGIVRFNDIRVLSGFDSSIISHALNSLVKIGLVEKLGKGNYTVKFKTPLCFIYSNKEQFEVKLISLLGLKEDREEPEPIVARSLLEAQGYSIREVIVITTERAINEWGGLLGDFSVKIIDSRDATNIQRVENFVARVINNYLHKEVIILDLTSLTKPATIAIYNLAVKNLIPLIYVYEQTRQLHWIQGRNLLKKRIESFIKAKP